MKAQSVTTGLSKMGLAEGASDIRTGSVTGSSMLHFGNRNDSKELRLLNLARNLLVRSRDMQNRIVAIEAASKTCICAKMVSDSVVDSLENARLLLIKMSKFEDPKARLILANSYCTILIQIDAVVQEGHYNNKNLAKNEKIVIPADVTGAPGFSITGIDMSCRALELQPFTNDIKNSDIVSRLAKIEAAENTLAAHCIGFDTIARLLQSRMKFARGMIDTLEESNQEISNSRAGHEAVSKVLSEMIWTNSSKKGRPK